MHSNLGASDVDDLIARLSCQKSEFQQTMDNFPQLEQKDLTQETQNIAELKKYLLELNKIQINFKKPKK